MSGAGSESERQQSGTVDLVTSGPDFEAITFKMRAKYGLMVAIMRLVDRLGHLGRVPLPTPTPA
jgi:hypothetical protein